MCFSFPLTPSPLDGVDYYVRVGRTSFVNDPETQTLPAQAALWPVVAQRKRVKSNDNAFRQLPGVCIHEPLPGRGIGLPRRCR